MRAFVFLPALLLLLGCARETAPVNLGENTSIGVLPSASASPTPPSASADLFPVANDEIVVPPILFRTGSEQLLPESEKTLNRVIDFLNARSDVRLLRVEVHTDSMGASAYNLALSEKRALGVATWLVDHGVDCHRLDAVGFGQTRPIAPNSTEEGRAKNRRTAFVIVPGGMSSHKKLCP